MKKLIIILVLLVSLFCWIDVKANEYPDEEYEDNVYVTDDYFEDEEVVLEDDEDFEYEEFFEEEIFEESNEVLTNQPEDLTGAVADNSSNNNSNSNIMQAEPNDQINIEQATDITTIVSGPQSFQQKYLSLFILCFASIIPIFLSFDFSVKLLENSEDHL